MGLGLSRGLKVLSRSTFSASREWGPLYSFYYAVIGQFINNPIEVYFIGGLVIQLLALCVVTFVSWALSRSLAISTLIFGLMLCSGYLLCLPRVSYLVAMLVVFGVWLARLEHRPANWLAVTLVISWVICFIRPEFVLTFYLTSALLGIVIIGWTIPELYCKSWLVLEDRSLYRLAVYLSVTGLCLFWSFPVVQGGHRAMMAFQQHYALRGRGSSLIGRTHGSIEADR